MFQDEAAQGVLPVRQGAPVRQQQHQRGADLLSRLQAQPAIGLADADAHPAVGAAVEAGAPFARPADAKNHALSGPELQVEVRQEIA